MSEEIKYLMRKKNEVLQELAVIKEERNSFNLPKSKLQRVEYLKDNPTIDIRNRQLSILQLDAEKRLGDIQIKLSTLRQEGEYSTDKILKNILLEVLPKELVYEIFDEVKRREEGENPILISALKMDDGKKNIQIKELRRLALENIEYIKKARLAINEFIENGMPEVNKSDYLISVRAINKCLPSHSEIEAIKNKIHRL